MGIVPDLINGMAENIFFFGFMFLFTLGIVITIHEFGHYFAARLCKVHVETFAFGFGREILGFGGGLARTRWSICMFPIGGFVKLFGDVDPKDPVVWDYENDCKRTLSDKELEVAFCTKTVWQRIFVVTAGPAINLLLSFMIFFLVFATYGQRSKPLTINALAVNSAAYDGGIQIGDAFLKMDGKKIRRLEDIYDFTWHENPPTPHSYELLRDGEVYTITFTAKRIIYTTKKGVERNHGQTGMVRMRVISFEDINSVGSINTLDQPDLARELILNSLGTEMLIGLPYKDESEERVDPFAMIFPADLNTHLNDPNDEHYDRVFLVDPNDNFYLRLQPLEAATRSLYWIKKIVVDSYKLMSVAYKGKTDEPVIGGISNISKHSANAAQAGIYDYLMFVAGFSLSIAFINLLPIPGLDGGYLVFFIFEAITGRALSAKVQNIAIIAGLVFLGGIMIFANVSDLIYMISELDFK